MKITIPYGHENIEFEIPDKNFCEILSPVDIEFDENEMQTAERAIENPIGSGKLNEIVNPGDKVNIICDDMSRPTPAHLILPVLTKKLTEAGVRKNDIKIVMALGSHRYMTEAEMIKKVGQETFSNYKVFNSEFKKEEDLVDLGSAPDGTRVYASKIAMDSDIRIGVGHIAPHPVMGWSGGAKILYPGIAGEQTVAHFHIAGALIDENLFGKDNSPVRLSVEKWVDNIGLHFIVNALLTSDFRIYDVVAGDYIQAHRKGVERAKRVWGKKVREKVDAVVVSSHPADQDFWQSGKGFYSAEPALKEGGGTILLVSPNYEGLGPHPEYSEIIGMDKPEEILVRLRNGENIPGDPLALAVGTAVSKMRRRQNLLMVGDGMSRDDIEKCKIRNYPRKDIQKAVDELTMENKNARISVITHGGELFTY